MADDKVEGTQSTTVEPAQPGAVIKPGGETPSPASSLPPQSVSNQEAAQAQLAAVPLRATSVPEQSSAVVDDDSVTWTASEFIAHKKNAGWYAALAGAAVLLAGAIVLVTRDFIASGIILFCSILLGIYGAREPQQLQYRVDDQGVTIGPKHHGYGEFRSFSVVAEGAFTSIVLMPLKRFAATKTLYYAPQDEEIIIDILLDYLPFEEHRFDLLDQFLHRIRF